MKITYLKSYFKSFLIGLLSVAFSSCAGPGDPQVRLAKDQFKSRKTYTQGIIGGAVGGAAIGAVIGGLTGDESWDNDRAKTGALYGGGLGAITGGVYADKKVKERERYIQMENSLDAAIQNARSTRNAASDFNRVLESRLAAVKRDGAILSGTVGDANSVLGSLDREISTQQTNLSNAKDAKLPATDRNKLQSEINSLVSIRNRISSNVDKLSRSSQRPPIAP